MFETVATRLAWPSEYWTLLLQTVLKGKAQRAYVSLSTEQCNHYDTVKDVILKAYELVPEAYRHKFRNTYKQREQTFVEYASILKDYFEQWIHSKKINDNFKKLKELILLENFLNHVPKFVAERHEREREDISEVFF